MLLLRMPSPNKGLMSSTSEYKRGNEKLQDWTQVHKRSLMLPVLRTYFEHEFVIPCLTSKSCRMLGKH